MSTERSSYLLRTMWSVLNEAEFYPLLCCEFEGRWGGGQKQLLLGILTVNYISPRFQKTKEHGNLDSKQASFDIRWSLLHKGNVFASYLLLLQQITINMVAETNFFFFFSSRGQKSNIDILGLKSRSQQGFISLEDCREAAVSLPFSLSRVHLRSLGCDSISSSKPAMTSQAILILTLTLTSVLFLSFAYKDFVITLGPPG